MIILISGCMSSGKSAVARTLARSLREAAHIELDDLHDCMPALPFEGKAFGHTPEAAVALTGVFARGGLHCVLTWPSGRERYDYSVTGLAPLGPPIHMFTLDTELDVFLTYRGACELADRERSRIRERCAEGRGRPAFGTIVNHTHLTPEQTADQILASLSAC